MSYLHYKQFEPLLNQSVYFSRYTFDIKSNTYYCLSDHPDNEDIMDTDEDIVTVNVLHEPVSLSSLYSNVYSGELLWMK